VQGVVGDRKANTGHADAHDEAEEPHPRQRQQAADNEAVRPEVQRDKHHRLADHRPIGVPRQPVLLEVVVDSGLDLTGEVLAELLLAPPGIRLHGRSTSARQRPGLRLPIARTPTPQRPISTVRGGLGKVSQHGCLSA
jgi:hypothetical protein